MHTDSDNSICSLANLLSDYVVAETVFIWEHYFIWRRSRLLFRNLLLFILIIFLWWSRLFLVIPCLNWLLTCRTHGFSSRRSWLHFFHILRTHAGRFRLTHAISIGSSLCISDFRLEECALRMRLWWLEPMRNLIALSIFTLVFIEVEWLADGLWSVLSSLRMMASKLNRMRHSHIRIIVSLNLKLLIKTGLLRSLIGLLTAHDSVSWTTGCSPDVSGLLICWNTLCCISGIIQMFNAISWRRRLEKEVILHLLTNDIFVARNISLCKATSILNCWSRIDSTVWLLVLLHPLILLVMEFLLIGACTILVSQHFRKSTLALSFISCRIVWPRDHHSALLVLLLLTLFVFLYAHSYILDMWSSAIDVLGTVADDHLLVMRRSWRHNSAHWTHTSHWDCSLSARSLMVEFLIVGQLVCLRRLLGLSIAECNINRIHDLLLFSFL